EQYWGAKLRLFEEHLRPDGIAVLASGCAQGGLVRAAVARRGARAVTAGPGGDVELEDVRELPAEEAFPGSPSERLRARLRVGAERHDVVLPTVHQVAVANLLLAATAVIALGGEPEVVAGALSAVAPPPGRLETVGHRGAVSAMVDTAHTPAPLRTALTRVRAR